MAGFAAWLYAVSGWLLGGAFLVTLGVVGYLYLAQRRAGAAEHAAQTDAAAPGEGPAAAPAELARSFRAALQTLRSYVPDRDFRYRIPWILWLGEPDSGKTTALAAAGLERPFPPAPEDPLSTKAGCRWTFFNQGVALDVAGSYFAGRNGRPADDAGWRTLLRLLRLHRGARPLDGVVLAIPASMLMGQGARQRVAARGEAAFARLREAQRVLGLKFPVYVLVTRCDDIPGWNALADALPARVRDQIFGWSSPHSADAAFAPSWLDEAYDELGTQLYRVQAEVLAESRDPDDIFRFPEELRATLPHLKVYLNELFKESVYHETFSLRGVYFTGMADPPAPARPDATAEPEEHPLPDGPRPIFLRHLLEKKVFAERGLVRPIFGTRMARDRAVVVSQALIVAMLLIGLPGLAWGYLHVKREGVRLTGELKRVHQDLGPLAEGGAGRRDVAVSELLDHMAGVRPGRFWSVFMPTSWVSPVRRRVSNTLGGTIGEVILPVMADSLRSRANYLLPREDRFAAYTPGQESAVRKAVDGGTAGLTAYIVELRDLGLNMRRYRRLARTHDNNVDDLRELVSYVFGEPARFANHAEGNRFFRRALGRARAEPLDIGNHTHIGLRVADEVVRGVYDELLGRVRLLARRVEDAGLDGAAPDLDVLRELSQEMAEVRSYVPEEDAYWLDPSAKLPPRILKLLESLPDSAAVRGAEFRELFPPRFESVRTEKLNGAESLMHTYGATLATDGAAPGAAAETGLSRSAMALRQALGALQGRRFAQGGARVPMAEEAPARGMVPAWDVRGLDDALAMHQEYAEFVGKDVAALPGGSRRLVHGLARVQLEGSVSSAVRRARTSAPAPASFGAAGRERAVAMRVAAHRPAATRLDRLATALDEAGLQAVHHEVSELGLRDAVELLNEVDGLLNSSGAYTPRDPDFSTWRGARPVAPAAFGVEDMDALEEYLAAERARIRALAVTYAAPILAGLETPGMKNYLAGRPLPATVARWRGIVETLDGYDTKKPGNTLAALESFIRTGMDAVELGNCIATMGTRRGTGDFFAQRREALRASLFARCRQITAGATTGGYEELRRAFNTTLAGRFPFAASAAGDPANDADPEQVRAFFRLYERMPTVRQGILRGAGGVAGPGTAQAEFFAQLDEVRHFLEPMLGSDTTGSAAFRVVAELRAHRAREAGGDQVADWTMEIGDTRLSLRDSAGVAAEWSPGDAVRLGLRWAEGSPVRPSPAGLPANARVRDQLLSVTWAGEWGMLRMLRQFAATPGELGVPPSRVRHTVALNVPTLAGDSVRGPAARVFVRVRLRSPAGGAEMVLPDFPTAAPALGRGAPETVLYP
ncbi:MAG TPA: type VI secretion protein IcmF/TssM N-terminal domain-containing protein [Longimicrobium sp.]|jgi:type VI secretion system protein ImpL